MERAYQVSSGAICAGAVMGQAMAHDACARQSHVDAQLSQLENTVVRLQSIFDLLTDRIGSVLYFTPDAGLNKCAPEETLAPLADRVRHSCQRLQELECRMNSVLTHIEL